MDDGAVGWPMDVAALHRSLADVGISGDSVARIVAAARPAVMLSDAPADESAVALGASKLGGSPDLPPGMSWHERPAYGNASTLAREARLTAERFHADAGLVPPWMSAEEGRAMLAENERVRAETQALLESLDIDKESASTAFSYLFTPEQAAEVAREASSKIDAVAQPFPLAFLAQIDLAALAGLPGFDPHLPREGRLLVFYDLFILPPSYHPASSVGLRVVHDTTPASELVRADVPEALQRLGPFGGTGLGPAALSARSVVTAVPQHAPAADALALPEQDMGAYGEWLSAVPGWPGDGAGDAHQLGGWRRAIQATAEGIAQLAANGMDAGTSDAFRSPEGKRLLADAGAWRLVFQFGPDEAAGNRLPGALNIFVREDDLASRRFDRAWAVYEQD